MSTTKIKIDFRLATDVLERLGFDLQDLSMEYGDVVIENGEISHQLWYDAPDSSCVIMGYVYQDREIFYVSGGGNYRMPQLAALELLDRQAVEAAAFAIEFERMRMPEYV